MKTFVIVLVGILILVSVSGFIPPAAPLAEVAQYGGTKATWPTVWTPLLGLNDGQDLGINGEVDIVGDVLDPAVYYASDGVYAYFRIRVRVATANSWLDPSPTFDDSHFIFIENLSDTDGEDSEGAGDLHPDYSFVWDTRTPGPGTEIHHGLELQEIDPSGDNSIWGGYEDAGGNLIGTWMDDIDNSEGTKISPPDFGWDTGDGYVRTIDGQVTTNFGTTTFIDFAIEWAHLQAHTTLDFNQDWMVQIGTVDAAVDHEPPNEDVAGGLAPTSPQTWPLTLTLGPTVVDVSSMEASPPVLGWTVGLVPVALLLGLASLVLLRRRV